ncbi:hypothetical protein ES703_75132 [subsurface metagenome]
MPFFRPPCIFRQGKLYQQVIKGLRLQVRYFIGDLYGFLFPGINIQLQGSLLEYLAVSRDGPVGIQFFQVLEMMPVKDGKFPSFKNICFHQYGLGCFFKLPELGLDHPVGPDQSICPPGNTNRIVGAAFLCFFEIQPQFCIFLHADRVLLKFFYAWRGIEDPYFVDLCMAHISLVAVYDLRTLAYVHRVGTVQDIPGAGFFSQ